MHNEFFPIRITPIEGESFKGFVLRVAHSLNYQSLNDFHKVIDFRLAQGNFERSSNLFRPFVSILAQFLKQDENELIAHFTYDECFDVDENRHVKHIKSSSPKVCLHCVKDAKNNMIKQEWLYHHHTHCEEHNVELLDKCPNCEHETSFRWVSDIFEGCPCCGIRWDEVSFKSTSIPKYQVAASSQKGIILKDYLAHLYHAVTIAGRPFDAMEHFYYHLPPFKMNTHKLFSIGYSLLANVEVRENLQDAMTNAWQTEIKGVTANGFRVLTEKVQRLHLLHDANYPLSETFSSLASFLPSSVNEIKHVNHTHLATSKLFADVLNIQDEDVMDLVTFNFLKSVNPDSKQALLDLKSIDTFLTQLDAHASKYSNDVMPANVSSFTELSGLAKSYVCGFGEIIDHILTSDIKVHVWSSPGDSKLSNYYVNNSDVYDFLDSHFSKKVTFPISLPKIKMLTRLKATQTSKFIEFLALEAIELTCRRKVYQTKKLAEFFSSKLLLNRWAKLNKVNTYKLKEQLEFEGIYPEQNSLLKHEIWIYPKTPDMERILKNYLFKNHQDLGAGPLFLCPKSFESFCQSITIFY
jgi:hypothetical protein